VGKSQEKNYGIIWNGKKCCDCGGGVHHLCWYYWGIFFRGEKYQQMIDLGRAE